MATFRSPHFIFGEDALEQIEPIPGAKCLIITDKNLVNIGLCKILTDKLDEFGKDWIIFDEVKPDPLEDLLLKAKKVCNDYNPDLIIGFGGGSSMDTAKAVWMLYENPTYGIDDIHPFNEPNMGVKAKCIAIPRNISCGVSISGCPIFK